ncbi:alkaline phosphatase family protein [Streptacidiphilus monticola]
MLPEVVARSLRAAGRGVIVLALDGLSHEVAAETLRHAHLRPLRSTFPSTSTTAWLTSVTGVPASEHGAVGMVYRSPGAASVTHLVTGRSIGFGDSQAADPATELVVPRATVFDLATAAGRPAHVLGAELERLSGAWVEALLHGARLLPRPPMGSVPTPSRSPSAPSGTSMPRSSRCATARRRRDCSGSTSISTSTFTATATTAGCAGP